MDDILASIRGHINERLNSPLFGAYALAWLFFNYKVPMLLFSNLDIHNKIFQIDSYLHGSPDRIYYVYGWPLLIASAYIFILPIPSYLVTAWNLAYQNRLAKMQQKILGKRVVLEEELVERASILQTSIESKDRRISELEAQNENLRNQRARAEAEFGEVAVKLSQSEEKSNIIPELERQISSADEQVKSLSSEAIEMSQKNRGLVDELELTSDILRDFANRAIPDSALKNIHRSVSEFASKHKRLPAPIEVLVATLGMRQMAEPVSKRGNALRTVGPGGALYNIANASGIAEKSFLSDVELFSFLTRFRDWDGLHATIGAETVSRLVDLMDTLDEEFANSLFSYIKSETTNFNDMPDPLKRSIYLVIEG